MPVVAPIEPSQVEAIAALAEEMDRFYGATGGEPLDVRIRQISQALFSDRPAAYALLAWEGDRALGFATYSFLWPAVGLTRSLYLNELYVAVAARRSGVGKQLMRALFETAVKLECSRVEWTADRENVDAQAFYELLGAPLNEGKLFYRLEGEQLRCMADGR
jgi:GNAT superfamily N-acetyltransferase